MTFFFRSLPKSIQIAVACFAFASTTLPSAHAITLDAAVSEALANNLDLRAAYLNVEIGRGKLIQAGLWPNPEFELTTTSGRPFTHQGSGSITRPGVGNLSATFSQAFPVSGRLKEAQRVARVDLAKALMEIRNRERILIGDVQKDFLVALILQRQIAVRNEVKGINEKFVETSQARLQKAEVSEVDVNLAHTEVQRLELENNLLSADLQGRLLVLKQRLGLKPQGTLSLDGDLERLLAKFDTKRAASSPLIRPDLRQAELELDRARTEIALARSEAWGDLTIGANYEEERRPVEGAAGVETERFAGLRFSVPLPLWNRNQGRIYQQQATADQAVTQVQALRLTIRAEVAAALARAEKLRDAVDLYKGSILPLYSKNISLLQQAYGQGLAEFSQIVQTQNQQSTLRISYFDALIRYAESLVDLETAEATNPHLRKDFLLQRTKSVRKPGSSYSK